jgi:hypothetical protein
MVGDLEIASDLPGPGASVLDKMGEALLPRIEVNGGDALSRLDQRYRNMHCDRRFARSAFFIRHDDNTGGWHKPSIIRLVLRTVANSRWRN